MEILYEDNHILAVNKKGSDIVQGDKTGDEPLSEKVKTYIKKKYEVEPGFITVNLPRLVDLLLDCGIEDPIVCSSINKIGQSMNPSREAYEQTISEKRFRPIAMSILASGAVNPKEAVEYVCCQPNIKSIVFGASSRQHIVETKELIESYS